MSAQEKYTDANKEVRKQIQADKRQYLEGLAVEAEAATAKSNLRDLYNTTQKLAGKYNQPN